MVSEVSYASQLERKRFMENCMWFYDPDLRLMCQFCLFSAGPWPYLPAREVGKYSSVMCQRLGQHVMFLPSLALVKRLLTLAVTRFLLQKYSEILIESLSQDGSKSVINFLYLLLRFTFLL